MNVNEMLLDRIKKLEMYGLYNYKLDDENIFDDKIYISEYILDYDKVISNIIIDYINVINIVISKEYLGILNKNIRNVKLNKQNIMVNDIDIKHGSFHAGGYYCEKNEIIYYDKSLYEHFFKNSSKGAMKQIITHELLHLSSTKFKDNNVYSGLSYNIIGNGLNEGYTEYLTNSLFDCNYVLTNYEYEKNIAIIINNFLGNVNMNKIYFTADNGGMITLLEEYSTYKNAMEFLKKIDYISENKKNKDINIHNNIISYHVNIINYILDIHTNKLIELLNDNKIIKDLAIDNISSLALFLFNNSRYIHSLRESDIKLLSVEIISNMLGNYIDKINNIKHKVLSK